MKGGPAARRAYFDRTLARLQPARARLPTDYAAAVAQRNAALRRAASGATSRDAIEPWTAQVATLGAELVAARDADSTRSPPGFAEIAGLFGLADATLAYEGEPPSARGAGVAARAGHRARNDGCTARTCTTSRLLAGSRDLRGFGSQGEQRLTLLALLLAEAALLAERRAVPPLLLLDDVLSELDPSRRRTLADLVAGTRTRRSSRRRSARRCRSTPRNSSRWSLDRLADDVRRELSRFGPQAEIGRLAEAWPAAVGEQIARNAWPARVARDGTLHVHTSSSAWAFELAQLEREVRGRLGDLAPKRLRFAPGPLPEPDAAERGEARRTPFTPRRGARETAAALAAPDRPTKSSGNWLPARPPRASQEPGTPALSDTLSEPANAVFAGLFLYG